jgi:hypothetical protein
MRPVYRQCNFSSLIDVTYSSSHGGKLGIGVVSRSNLNDISTNQVDSLKATKNGAELAGRPATRLGSTSSGSNYSKRQSCFMKSG